MDASDRLKKFQTQTIWTYYKTTTLAAQPTCNFSTCGQSLQSTCVVRYTDYEYRNQVATGRKNCSGCSTFCQ